MLLLPEKLVDVVIEVPDPELAQPGVLDGCHALGDVPDYLVVEEELKSHSELNCWTCCRKISDSPILSHSLAR